MPYELKTKQNDASVDAFLAGVANDQRRKDAQAVCALMRKLTKESGKMWGASIVGFGSYRYTYASGQSGDWFVVGFSPRKQSLTLYLNQGYEGKQDLLRKLGPHSTGKSCLYIKKLDDIDQAVLTQLIKQNLIEAKRR